MKVEIDILWLLVILMVSFNAWMAREQGILGKTVRENGVYQLWDVVSGMELEEIQAIVAKCLPGGGSAAVTGPAPWYAPALNKMVDNAQQAQLIKAKAEADISVEAAKKLFEPDPEEGKVEIE